MTSEVPVWEPYEASFADQEDAITYFRGQVIINETIARGRKIINYLLTGEEESVDFADDENFFDALNYKVNVARLVVLKENHGVTSESLSQK